MQDWWRIFYNLSSDAVTVLEFKDQDKKENRNKDLIFYILKRLILLRHLRIFQFFDLYVTNAIISIV